MPVSLTPDEYESIENPTSTPAPAEQPSRKQRMRLRDEVLDDRGRLIPDSRPVMAAIAFAPEKSIEQRFAEMMLTAEQRVLDRIEAAKNSNIDFARNDPGVHAGYDDEDDMSEDEELDPRYVSPYEFVPDSDIKRDVPRALKGMFKPRKKPAPKGEAPAAPQVAEGASPASSEAGKPSSLKA